MKTKTRETLWGQKYRGREGNYVVSSFIFPYGEETEKKFPGVAAETYYLLVNVDGGYYSEPTTDIEQIFGDNRDQFTLIEKK